MLTKSRIGCLVYLILIIFCVCDGFKRDKFKRKVDVISRIIKNKLPYKNVTAIYNETNRGFLSPGNIFSLGKVLNFFPVGGEKECQPTGFNIAKAGICLNPYDCRQRDGKASGDCAHGFGVCCVCVYDNNWDQRLNVLSEARCGNPQGHTPRTETNICPKYLPDVEATTHTESIIVNDIEVTCGAVIQNNLTYFMSPGFPELWTGDTDCTVNIEQSHAGIMQLRIDFIHFTIGQPNRTTGACDEDAMILGEGESNFTLCGQNHAQHIYYNLPTVSETRETGELPSTKSTPLVIRMRGTDMPRLWLLRLAQMPLAQSSPHNCLQYYINDNGTIRTFNFASNGRHLASQEYRACVRRNVGFCSIRYTPCDNRSFRIGPRGDTPVESVTEQMDEMMPVSEDPSQDEEEGSGSDPQIMDTSTPQPGMISRIWSYIWPSWGQRSMWKWSPYLQHYNEVKLKYYGYGNYFSNGFGRLSCTDRVTIPCENEYFVSSQMFGPGVCDPHHCGSSLCSSSSRECHIDTSITPYAVSVHFGPPTVKANPEDNIGMCLRYTQIPCNS